MHLIYFLVHQRTKQLFGILILNQRLLEYFSFELDNLILPFDNKEQLVPNRKLLPLNNLLNPKTINSKIPKLVPQNPKLPIPPNTLLSQIPQQNNRHPPHCPKSQYFCLSVNGDILGPISLAF